MLITAVALQLSGPRLGQRRQCLRERQSSDQGRQYRSASPQDVRSHRLALVVPGDFTFFLKHSDTEPVYARAAPAAGTKRGTLGSEPGTLISSRLALGMQRSSPSNAEPLRRTIAVGWGNTMMVPRRGTLALPPLAHLN